MCMKLDFVLACTFQEVWPFILHLPIWKILLLTPKNLASLTISASYTIRGIVLKKIPIILGPWYQHAEHFQQLHLPALILLRPLLCDHTVGDSLIRRKNASYIQSCVSLQLIFKVMSYLCKSQCSYFKLRLSYLKNWRVDTVFKDKLLENMKSLASINSVDNITLW